MPAGWGKKTGSERVTINIFIVKKMSGYFMIVGPTYI